MRPGLDAIRALCGALGDPQDKFRAIHVAGTNGKGAVCAMLSAVLGGGRYTSPHLIKINERFVINGQPISDEKLEYFSKIIHNALNQRGLSPSKPRGLSPSTGGLSPSTGGLSPSKPGVNQRGLSPSEPRGLSPFSGGLSPGDVTFFEALTAVAFLAFADAKVDCAILECGLGGRLDATNICRPRLCVITRIGLDHCDWLGDTVEKIAFEKAGIIKPGVPVVLGANEEKVRTVISSRATEVGAPFFYAPELANESEIPAGFPLAGAFNRENAVTAIVALKVLRMLDGETPDTPGRRESMELLSAPLPPETLGRMLKTVWPGRFQRVGDFIIDGAHNPPAADALAATLAEEFPGRRLALVAGFCGDKDVDRVLRTLAPRVSRGFAVMTNNPRSLSADETAARMRAAGIEGEAYGSLAAALSRSRGNGGDPTLVCGSLFLAGEALAELGAYPWGDASRVDPSEALRPSAGENMV